MPIAASPQVRDYFGFKTATDRIEIALTLSLIGVFPMTSHVECVAHLVKSDSDLRRSDSR